MTCPRSIEAAVVWPLSVSSPVTVVASRLDVLESTLGTSYGETDVEAWPVIVVLIAEYDDRRRTMVGKPISDAFLAAGAGVEPTLAVLEIMPDASAEVSS